MSETIWPLPLIALVAMLADLGNAVADPYSGIMRGIAVAYVVSTVVGWFWRRVRA